MGIDTRLEGGLAGMEPVLAGPHQRRQFSIGMDRPQMLHDHPTAGKNLATSSHNIRSKLIRTRLALWVNYSISHHSYAPGDFRKMSAYWPHRSKLQI